MLERLKKIEKDLMDVYNEIKEQYPTLNNLTFEITAYETSRTNLHGFYHIGPGCKSYRKITELSDLVSEAKERRLKDQILYQKFEEIL